MDIQEKTNDELREIISMTDYFGSKIITEAKELLSERGEQLNAPSKSSFEKELFSITKKQQKDIKEMKNYMLFFVVITVIGLIFAFVQALKLY